MLGALYFALGLNVAHGMAWRNDLHSRSLAVEITANASLARIADKEPMEGFHIIDSHPWSIKEDSFQETPGLEEDLGQIYTYNDFVLNFDVKLAGEAFKSQVGWGNLVLLRDDTQGLKFPVGQTLPAVNVEANLKRVQVVYSTGGSAPGIKTMELPYDFKAAKGVWTNIKVMGQKLDTGKQKVTLFINNKKIWQIECELYNMDGKTAKVIIAAKTYGGHAGAPKGHLRNLNYGPLVKTLDTKDEYVRLEHTEIPVYTLSLSSYVLRFQVQLSGKPTGQTGYGPLVLFTNGQPWAKIGCAQPAVNLDNAMKTIQVIVPTASSGVHSAVFTLSPAQQSGFIGKTVNLVVVVDATGTPAAGKQSISVFMNGASVGKTIPVGGGYQEAGAPLNAVVASDMFAGAPAGKFSRLFYEPLSAMFDNKETAIPTPQKLVGVVISKPDFEISFEFKLTGNPTSQTGFGPLLLFNDGSAYPKMGSQSPNFLLTNDGRNIKMSIGLNNGQTAFHLNTANIETKYAKGGMFAPGELLNKWVKIVATMRKDTNPANVKPVMDVFVADASGKYPSTPTRHSFWRFPGSEMSAGRPLLVWLNTNIFGGAAPGTIKNIHYK